MTDPGNLRHLPLEHLHVAAGARFGGFAGWSMPLTYTAGVMKEHLHTRESVGLFDISHMQLFEVEGPEATALIARACPLDAAAMPLSQSKYSFFLNEQGGIIDDLIVTRLGPERFMIVANAGNAATDAAHLAEVAAGFDANVTPLDRVFLALQGPASAAVLSAAAIHTASLTFMHGIEPAPGWFMTRSGYTGEDGFEIALPAAEAEAFTAPLLENGTVQWIGLAARDSLRLEAGLCLHGQDITPETSPVEAGLMWAIAKPLRADGQFIGAAALSVALARGPTEKRVGIAPDGRQPVRGGALLFDEAGERVGRVTSGGFGPSVNAPVAMGYVTPDLATPGTRLFAEVRGNRVPVAVHTLPFTPHRYVKG